MNRNVKPEPVSLPHPALEDADWADSYVLEIGSFPMPAETFAREMFERPPPWAQRLLDLRNALVRPLGLVADGASRLNDVNGFPIVSSGNATTILGFDDRHLDFRVVISITDAAGKAQAHVTTLVRRHGIAGRLYLAFVLPFHRRIVPAMMRRVSLSVK